MINLAALHAVTEEADRFRSLSFSETETVGEYFAMNALGGAFVGEHTGFVVCDPRVFANLLAIAESAEVVAGDGFDIADKLALRKALFGHDGPTRHDQGSIDAAKAFGQGPLRDKP